MGEKLPFVTRDQLERAAAQWPTPFHVYSEKLIRERARALKAAFSWNPGFTEYFAVKATPNPTIVSILVEEGCGCDCAPPRSSRLPAPAACEASASCSPPTTHPTRTTAARAT